MTVPSRLELSQDGITLVDFVFECDQHDRHKHSVPVREIQYQFSI